MSVAVAQGPLMISEPAGARTVSRAPTSGRVPDGGLMEAPLPRPMLGTSARLLLRDPDLGMAHRIVAALAAGLGSAATATVEDPGAVLITPSADADEGLSALLARAGELRVRPAAVSRLLVDARDGTIVAGADLVVGDGIVSRDGITLVIGDTPAPPGVAPDAAAGLPTGTTVREVAEALRAAHATAQQTSAIFLALRDAGALRAEVVIR
jgi:flagellar P-ring protein precursor FlgI